MEINIFYMVLWPGYWCVECVLNWSDSVELEKVVSEEITVVKALLLMLTISKQQEVAETVNEQ